MGLKYSFEEVQAEIPEGYEYESIAYTYVDEDHVNPVEQTGNNGIYTVSGNTWHYVTVTNQQLTSISFTKVWRTYDGAEILPWPEDKTIHVTVRSGSDVYASYTITGSSLTQGARIKADGDADGTHYHQLTVIQIDEETNRYVFKLSGLDNLTDGKVYTVSEAHVEGYQPPKYYDAGGDPLDLGITVLEDGGTIANDMVAVALPNSGGPGAAVFTMAGTVLALTSGIVLTLRKRRSVQKA